MTLRADDPHDRVGVIRQLIASESGERDEPVVLLRRVCRAASRELSASGVGVTVMADGGVRGISVASGPAGEQVEELQFVLGEGPCIDAFAARHPVLTADLTSEAMTRWPVYGPAAYAAGVRAVFAFPLQFGAARLGVMEVIRGRPGSLTDNERTTALVFADVTVEALLAYQEGAAGRDDDGDLNVLRRNRLFQAQGMVMVQLGISIGEALVRMRAHAYAENRRLDDVARDVVDRTLNFDRDHE